MLRSLSILVCAVGVGVPALVPGVANAMPAPEDAPFVTHHPKPKHHKAERPPAEVSEGSADNPLAGGPWGVYTGDQDGVWPAYERAGGEEKALLAKVALQPRVRWLHSGLGVGELGEKMRSEIAQEQDGNPDALVQFAWFRLWPHGEGARNRPLSGAEQADYRAAVDAAVDAIGDARVAMILEPDLALTAPPMRRGVTTTADPGVRQSLVAYAAERFSSLPRTSVYLDAGDADWLDQGKALSVLEASGIKYARGFALGATHYSSLAGNISYGAHLVSALEQAGYGTKHFVVDTADNGRPFTWSEYYAKHPHGYFNNAETCGSTAEELCDTLGPAPTWETDKDGLGLDAEQQAEASEYADGYLWFGRPWLVNQAAPFSLERTLQVARTTPYDQTNVTGG
ncbi:glycoside hydrolase family 6 protein [Nocardioides cheoyonin]|uniref:glycoside hydrolase family 6 protein n=1 Tax=Nocardioides cheoyonin TaxID=3156615 RepID=UPI0032B3A8FC